MWIDVVKCHLVLGVGRVDTSELQRLWREISVTCRAMCSDGPASSVGRHRKIVTRNRVLHNSMYYGSIQSKTSRNK